MLQPEIDVVFSEQDAVLTIVLSALNIAKQELVIVFANNTEIIVLLLYTENHKKIYCTRQNLPWNL